MSDDLWVADPETEHRRRALWGLLILGFAAVIFVALMVFFLGSSNNTKSGLPNTSDIPLTTGTPSSSSSVASTHASSSSSRPPSRSASTTATTSCASGTSCVLQGDAGKVIQAINAYRTQNGQTAVPGTTTPEAQNCSLTDGGGSTCPSSYFWEPVTPQDGAAVVQKIATRSDGRSFLLDPNMKSLQIGWAYSGGEYSCTVVAVG